MPADDGSRPALICKKTGQTFPLDSGRWCGPAGEILDIHSVGNFTPDGVRHRPPTLWRYREALPILRDESIVTFGEGYTPLLDVELFGRKVLAKLEHLFPTGSYKDRGASVLVSAMRELGVTRAVGDSSGNAGAAIAAYAARAGIRCEIFVPEETSPAKCAQIEAFGALLRKVPGHREDAARAAQEAAREIYYASHCWNPFFLHGTKTFAYEVAEQLGWKAPDAVVIPTGNGTLLLGAYIGFRELCDWGLVESMPKLIAVQAAACSPLFEAWRGGSSTPMPVEHVGTMAEGIAIAEPVRGAQCLAAVRATGGEILALSDDAIGEALGALLAGGFFVEPTSAIAVAALKELGGASERVVVPLTGHGLKAAKKVAACRSGVG